MKYLLTPLLLTAAFPAFAHHSEEVGGFVATTDHAPIAALVFGAVLGLFALRRLFRAA